MLRSGIVQVRCGAAHIPPATLRHRTSILRAFCVADTHDAVKVRHTESPSFSSKHTLCIKDKQKLHVFAYIIHLLWRQIACCVSFHSTVCTGFSSAAAFKKWMCAPALTRSHVMENSSKQKNPPKTFLFSANPDHCRLNKFADFTTAENN